MEIVLLSYNHQNLTKSACHSIVKLHPDCPVSIVHNGSRPEVVLELKKEFPHLSHLEIGTNQGFTVGANTGINDAFTRSEWVLFYTNDLDVASVPRELPKSAGLYFPLSYRRKVGGKVDSHGGLFNPLLGKLRHCRTLDDFNKKNPLWISYATGVAFLLHRDVWQKAGCFDESFHTYWEDVDLSMRVIKSAFPILPWKGWEICHKIGRTCHKEPLYTKELFWKNRKVMMKRYRFFSLKRFFSWK